jgi:AcrR family transcriptional regulator
VREIAAPLFEGTPPLFAYLDRSSYKGDNREFDGRVSVHNMHDFLKTYETMSEMGQNQWPYTEKNAQYVRDLLDFKYPELTGENFAGFSAQALCRRAGLTKMSVKHYEDYAVLATAWKQALSEDVSFRQDIQNVKVTEQISVQERPCVPPVDTTCPQIAPEKPCAPVVEMPPPVLEIPCTQPAETPCAPVEKAPLAPKSNCDSDAGSDAELASRHDREVRLRLEQMSTFDKGGSYWRMASKFLHAGMRPCDTDDVTNQDINRLMRSFVKINHSTINRKGLPNPMVHPGDTVPVSEHLEELVARHDKLAKAIERMMNAEQ